MQILSVDYTSVYVYLLECGIDLVHTRTARFVKTFLTRLTIGRTS